jgi:hypothetical protein
MSQKAIVGVFVLGAFALVAAGMLPGLQSATTDGVNETRTLEVGEPDTVQDKFILNATEVSVNGSNATVTVTDLESQERNTTTLNVSQSETLEVGGESVDVSVEEVRSSSTTVVRASYSSLYGMDDGPRLVFENLGLLILMVGFIMIIVIASVVVM